LRRLASIPFALSVVLMALSASADVALIAPDGKVGFRIPYAVTIAPGTIFYETSAGRSHLTGSPSPSSASENKAEWQWKMSDGRLLSISFEPSKNGYTMKLSASPNEGIFKWGFALKASAAADGEYFTGLMERVVDGDDNESWKPGITQALDLRGQKVEMLVKPTTAIYAPFFLSSSGYGLAVNSTWPGLLDFCAESPNLVQVSFEGPSLQCRFYISKDPAAIVRAHAMESGPPFMPPEWAFTPWRWRDEHSNLPAYYDSTKVDAPYNSQVVEDILMMEALGIPCGVYWLDRPWAVGRRGYDDFNWDEGHFPKHIEMTRWLDSKNIRLMIWIAPWVMGNMHMEARARNYDLPGQIDNNDRVTLIDFTNPEATKWWQQPLKKLLKDGMAGFKLDRAEEQVPCDTAITVHDGRTTRELHNDYPHLYIKAVHQAAREVRGDDFVLMPRAAFAGSTRYGVFWGGDAASTDLGLRASIVAVQRCAVMGYPFWGSDTGGYRGRYEPLDREVTARWLAFSAFCPIMEVGPTRNRSLWDMPTEPRYDVELIAIWRLYAEVHSRLADYSYKHAKEAHASGMPIVRPLFLTFPDQKEAWRDWQTYLYGGDILVSPIWKKGITQHTLYLPAGEGWIDAWEPAKEYEGGRYFTVDAPLYRMPIFIRKGSKVNLGDLQALYKDSLARAERKPDLARLQKTVR